MIMALLKTNRAGRDPGSFAIAFLKGVYKTFVLDLKSPSDGLLLPTRMG